MKRIIKFNTLPFVVLLFTIKPLVYAADADFSVKLDKPCSPVLVTFTNLSQEGPGIQYIWDFGKGAIIISTEKILTELYSQPGKYDVTLTVVEGVDSNSVTKLLEIGRPPEASFITDSVQGCIPVEINFTSNSTQGDAEIIETFWDFRNGITKYGTNVTNHYPQAGNFDVFLRITDAQGCMDIFESRSLIRIHEKPRAEFSSETDFGCSPPSLINFTNLSEGAGLLTSEWSFGDGNNSDDYSASNIYNQSGTYDVGLIVTDASGCSDTLLKESFITIGPDAGDVMAIFGDDTTFRHQDTICPGLIRFETTYPSEHNFYWKIEHGGQIYEYQNNRQIELQLPDSGMVDIIFIYAASTDCADTLSKSFYIDHIISDFEMDRDYTCQIPVEVTFMNYAQNAAQYEWIFPDESRSFVPEPVYTVSGNHLHHIIYNHEINNFDLEFYLVATNANLCSDTAKYLLNASLPVARFMPDTVSGCIPLDVNFSDSSKSVENILSRTYIINDQTFPLIGPGTFTHTFSDTGTYAVKLIITNEAGCTDTSYAIEIKTGDVLVPDFNVSPAELCFGDSLLLKDITPGGSNIDYWQYHSPSVFSTGQINISENYIVIKPDSSGSQDIHVQVNFNGCESERTISDAYTVKGPTGTFNENFSCEVPYSYTFLSAISGAEQLTWQIDDQIFNDVDTLAYTFASSGDFTVVLSAVNNTSGCSISESRLVQVRNISAEFNLKSVYCMGELAEFDASLSADYINNCYIEGFLWTINDGTPPRRTYLTEHEHIFGMNGEIKVQLIATGDNGCSDTTTHTTLVSDPRISITADKDSGCGPQLDVELRISEKDPNINWWIWNFNDGSPVEILSERVNHLYTGESDIIYSPAIMAKDIYDCWTFGNTTVKIINPSAAFQVPDPNICAGETVDFILSDNRLENLVWDYGDGTPLSSLRSHTFNNRGNFSVTLSGTRGSCPTSFTRNDYISVQEADARYSLSDSIFDCYPAMVEFDYLGRGDEIINGLWTFTTGSQSQTFSENFSYTYSRPGIYQSSLTVSTLNGCQATGFKTIEVDGPEAKFSFDPTALCSGEEVLFTIDQIDEVDSILWIFGDGSISPELSPAHHYNATGYITPALMLSKGDCDVTLSEDQLYVSLIEADFNIEANKTFHCLEEVIDLINNSVDYNSNVWRLNDQEIGTTNNLQGISFNETGDYRLSLEVYNYLNCADTTERIITVIADPEFQIFGDSSICKGEDAHISVTPQTGWTINWLPIKDIDNPVTFNITSSPDSSMNILATVTDSNGCRTTENFYLTILEPSEITRQPMSDTSIFIGEQISLNISSKDKNLKVQWEPAYRISCRECLNTNVSPYIDMTYLANVEGRCYSASLDFFIEVIVDFYLELPKAFSPNNDGNNDIFKMETRHIGEIDFKIYNRWGNLVYSSKDKEEGWDGRHNGKDQNSDTYSYYIIAKTIHGYEFEKKGTFVLIR